MVIIMFLTSIISPTNPSYFPELFMTVFMTVLTAKKYQYIEGCLNWEHTTVVKFKCLNYGYLF